MKIPYGKQSITEGDIQAVVDSLKSDFLTQGPQIDEFERCFADYVGSNYAVAVSNGTAALHLSVLALNLKAGDKVITTPITFAASANCVRYCGADVVFSDIDPETFLLDIDGVRKLVEESEPGTYKGIIPVDFSGRPINMEAFRRLADDHGLWLLEDACHAPGGYFLDSKFQRQYCGNGHLADLAIFSFHPVKHIATGEGGMITTNDERLFRQLLQLRTHGISRETGSYQNSIELAEGLDATTSSTYPGWYMEMQMLGYNYRLSDIQAALGISQLKRADWGLSRRRNIAEKYFEAFKDIASIKAQSGIVEGHAYHLYVIQVEDRLGLYNHLKANGIYAQIHYIPCHMMPYYRDLGWKVGDMPRAEEYYRHCISLPMYPGLNAEEQAYVIEKVLQYIN